MTVIERPLVAGDWTGKTFAIGGTVARTVAARLGDLAYNMLDYDAGQVGATDDQPKFLAAFTAVQANGGKIVVPGGTYPLASNATVSAGDTAYWQDPKAVFTGTGFMRFGNIIPYMPQPVYSMDVYSKSYGTEWNGYKNILQRASVVTANVARGGAGVGPAVIAQYACATTAVDSSAAWGFNVNGVSAYDGTTCICIESDSQAMTASAKAVNLLLVAAGLYPSNIAIQIQSNNANAVFQDGIYFNNRQAGAINGTYPVGSDIPAVSGSYIKSDAGTATRGVYFAATTFTTSEWESSNWLVGPTVTLNAGEYRSCLRVDGSKTANPAIQAKGGDGVNPVNLVQSALLGGDIIFSTTDKNTDFQVRVKHFASSTSYMTLTGGAGDVTVSVAGSVTNGSVAVTGKGTGGGKMRDGAGVMKFQWNTTGVGFFAATPVAKQSLSSSLPTDGSAANSDIATAINAIRTALTNYGLA